MYIPVHFEYQGNAKALCEYWSKHYKEFKHIYLVKNPKKYKNKSNLIFKKLNFSFLYDYYTSKYIIRESEINSYIPTPNKKSIVVQLWHAAGAFKKFCLDVKRNRLLIMQREKDCRSWKLALCTSKKIISIYSKAFNYLPENRFIVTGLPRNDYLYIYKDKRKEIMRYLKLQTNKPLLLYAPTFRDKVSDYKFVGEILIELYKKLSHKFKITFRLHPKLTNKIKINKVDIINLTGSYEIEMILSVTDILITDYSSIIFDFALLERPMFFYAPDLEEYYDKRGFYFDYCDLVPGPICKTKKELIKAIEEYDFDYWKPIIKKFKQDFQPDFDGKNCERVLKKILEY